MPFSNKPWSQFSESDYETAEKYCSACLIDMNPSGEKKKKELCKLRVKEPSGVYNRNGIHAAAASLAGAREPLKAPASEKKKAARKLLRLYREMGDEPPDSLKRIAR